MPFSCIFDSQNKLNWFKELSVLGMGGRGLVVCLFVGNSSMDSFQTASRSSCLRPLGQLSHLCHEVPICSSGTQCSLYINAPLR